MKRTGLLACALTAALAIPASAAASRLNVEVWTDRGGDAVYENGEHLRLGVRANDDSHLLVYEIDADGYVHVLFPYGEESDVVEGRHTYRIPEEHSDMDLVVEGPVGQGYIVAIASSSPFDALPWYLRPYNPQAAALGYEGEPDEEEGVTEEGRIVGDPFVAMERIRRRVLSGNEDPDAFATAYTSYYVHQPVKYPRYLCYDCHRPGYWAWWTGFDPYYTTCSAFTFRVNYSWHWGPSYWFGYVPYYVYSCRPGYGWGHRHWYSGWDGWGVWRTTWNGPLRRKTSLPPLGYIPPDRYKEGTPPGLISEHQWKRRGMQGPVPIGHNSQSRDGETGRSGADRGVQPDGRSGVDRAPVRDVRGSEGSRSPSEVDRGVKREPAGQTRGGEGSQAAPGNRGAARPQPAQQPKRGTEPAKSPNKGGAAKPQPAKAPPQDQKPDEAKPEPAKAPPQERKAPERNPRGIVAPGADVVAPQRPSRGGLRFVAPSNTERSARVTTRRPAATGLFGRIVSGALAPRTHATVSRRNAPRPAARVQASHAPRKAEAPRVAPAKQSRSERSGARASRGGARSSRGSGGKR